MDGAILYLKNLLDDIFNKHIKIFKKTEREKRDEFIQEIKSPLFPLT